MLKERTIRIFVGGTNVIFSYAILQAVVEIYAHFYIPDTSRNAYLTHRKAMFRVTDLVRERLRIADTSIAMLSGNLVEGLRPGRTEVQVRYGCYDHVIWVK